MSRRKQLNPKAIKVDDSLTEEVQMTEEMSFTFHDKQGGGGGGGGEDSEDDRLIISEASHSPNNPQTSFDEVINSDVIQTAFFLDNIIKLEPGSANNLQFIHPSHLIGQKTSKSRRKSDRILPLPTNDGFDNFKCPICGDILTSNHELTKHIRSHNSPSEITPTINSCKICGKILSSMSSLDRHMLVHSGERPFQCRICHMAFTTNGNMHRHMRIHVKDQDPLADQGFFKDGVVYKPPKKKRISENFSDVPHKKMRNSYPSNGELTGLKLLEDSNQIMSAEFYKHITQTIQQPCEEIFEINPTKGGNHCKLCGVYFYSLYGFMEHLSDHSVDDSNPDDSLISYKCLPCNCKFKTLKQLETHLVGKHPTFAVGLSMDDFNKKILSEKLKVEFSNLQMDNINKYEVATFEITSNKFLLTSGGDKYEIDKNNNTNDSFVSNKILQNAAGDGPSVDVSIPVHSSSDDLTPNPASVSFCPQCCGMSFLSLEERRVHELSHHTTKEIVEGWCGENVDDPRGNIDQREFMLVLGLHSNGRNVIEHKNNLKFLDYIGVIPTPVVMEMMECKSELLNYHREGIQFLPFIPPPPPLSLHRSPPPSSDNQLYRCTECPFTCTESAVLYKHERIHKSERFYKCLKCSQTFTTKANCERHLRKKHSLLAREEIEKFSQLVKSSNPDDDPTSSNSPRLVETICKYCGEDFKVERALKHHLRSQSSCQHKPYTCQVCSTGFSTKANCLRHIQKQHPDLQPYEVYMKVNLDLIEAQKKINRSPMIGIEERRNVEKGFDFKRSIHSSKLVQEIPKNELDCGTVLDLRQMNVVEAKIDEPLDFSLKKDEANMKSKVGQPVESPVDLSLRKPWKQAILSGNSNIKPQKSTFVSLKSILKPSIVPNNLDLKHYNPRTNMFHCPICGAIFKQSEKLQSHLPTHNLAPSSSDTSSSSSPSFSSSLLSSPKLSSTHAQFNLSRKYEQQDCMDDKMSANNNNTIFKNANLCNLDVGHDNDLALISSVISSLPSPFTSSISQCIPSLMMKSTTTDRPAVHKERLNEKRVRPGCFQRLKLGISSGRRNSYSDSPHKLKCHFCPRAFPWISSLKRHLLTHTGHKPYKCLKCMVTFSTKSNRERHMMRKHGINIRGQSFEQFDQTYNCHLCESVPFTSLDMLLEHHRQLHAHPEFDFPRPLIIEPQDIEGEEFKEIEYGDDDDDDLNNNSIQITSNTMTSDEEELQGDTSAALMCNNTLLSVLVSRTKSTPAIPIAHPLSNPISLHVNPERDNYNVDKITRCWKCDQLFDCRKGLLRHLKEHNVDLPFKCYLCDASFDTRIDSLLHKISAHPQDWLSVKEKNKVGDDVRKYSDFMERIVEETLSGNLEGRILSSDGFDLDLRPETDYAQRKVFCTLCPKRFWSLQDLRRHMRSHTGERPFECDVCQARFTLKHSMMRHRRKHQSSAISPSNFYQNVLNDNVRIFNGNNNNDDFNLLDEMEGNYVEAESYEDHSIEEVNADDHIDDNDSCEDENYELVIDQDVEHHIQRIN